MSLKSRTRTKGYKTKSTNFERKQRTFDPKLLRKTRKSKNFTKITKRVAQLEREKEEILDRRSHDEGKRVGMLRELNLKALEHEKEVDEITKERDNLKEIVFDLMFEKQRAGDSSIPKSEFTVDTADQLQSELAVQSQRSVEVDSSLQTLLRFANEQIKARSLSIKLLVLEKALRETGQEFDEETLDRKRITELPDETKAVYDELMAKFS